MDIYIYMHQERPVDYNQHPLKTNNKAYDKKDQLTKHMQPRNLQTTSRTVGKSKCCGMKIVNKTGNNQT